MYTPKYTYHRAYYKDDAIVFNISSYSPKYGNQFHTLSYPKALYPELGYPDVIDKDLNNYFNDLWC